MIFYTLELVCKRKLHPFSFHWTQTSWQPFRSHCGQALHSQFSFSSGSPFKVMHASSRVNLTEEKAQQKEKRNGKKLRKFHSNNNRAVNFCSDTSAKTLIDDTDTLISEPLQWHVTWNTPDPTSQLHRKSFSSTHWTLQKRYVRVKADNN